MKKIKFKLIHPKRGKIKKKTNIEWTHQKRVFLFKLMIDVFGKYDVEKWQRNSMGDLDVTAKSPKGMSVEEL